MIDALLQRFHDLGQIAASNEQVWRHPGTDLAKVRAALAIHDADRVARGHDRLTNARRKAFADGVRAKLAAYRSAGVIT